MFQFHIDFIVLGFRFLLVQMCLLMISVLLQSACAIFQRNTFVEN